MAKKKSKSYLDKSKDLAEVLLYKTTGGAMGIAPGKETEGASFSEMKALLDMMLRIHALELKGSDENDDEPSAFELIQKEAKNGSKKAKSGSFEATNQYFADAKRAELARDGSESE
jgi:hypothetical protein